MEEGERISALLFACLRSAVTNEVLAEEHRSFLTNDRQKALFALSKEHDLAHLIAFVLEENHIPMEDKTAKNFHRLRMTAVYRYELLYYEQQRIETLFKEANISFLPLKGAVLRDYYPSPWMRTSCDIDLLIKEESLNSAVSLLQEKLGYRSDGTNDHDVQLYAQNGTHLELHFTLCVKNAVQDKLLKRVWNYADENGTLSMEFQLYYVLCHMAKHVLNGGCGVRPFLDLFLLHSKQCYDEETLYTLCEEGGLDRFCVAAFRLANVWFSGETPTQEDLTLQDYLLGAGVYGNTENRVAVGNVKKGGKFGYLLSRLFPPKHSIFQLYSSAQKYPCLLPFYYFRRFFRLFLPDRRRASLREWKASNAVTDDVGEKMTALLERLGL